MKRHTSPGLLCWRRDSILGFAQMHDLGIALLSSSGTSELLSCVATCAGAQPSSL